MHLTKEHSFEQQPPVTKTPKRIRLSAVFIHADDMLVITGRFRNSH